MKVLEIGSGESVPNRFIMPSDVNWGGGVSSFNMEFYRDVHKYR